MIVRCQQDSFALPRKEPISDLFAVDFDDKLQNCVKRCDLSDFSQIFFLKSQPMSSDKVEVNFSIRRGGISLISYNTM